MKIKKLIKYLRRALAEQGNIKVMIATGTTIEDAELCGIGQINEEAPHFVIVGETHDR